MPKNVAQKKPRRRLRALEFILVAMLVVACGRTIHDDRTALGEEASNTTLTTGFDPQRDGFGFENYGFADVTNLTAADLQRLFGDEVCVSVEPTCTLIPPARIWMEALNTAMDVGHCEGMAVLSQHFYFGVLKPQRFGSATVAQLKLQGNEALQREIAYWWSTQATYPTRAHHTILDAVAAIDVLRGGMQPKASVDVLYTMGIYTSKGRGGHTVTPIGLRTIDESHTAIEIYDNNVPNTTQEIIVDTLTNTWRYESIVPGGSTTVYAGDATSETLDMTETSPRLERQICQFCPGNPLQKGVEELTTILFSSALPNTTGDAPEYSAYVEDSAGRRSGIVLGTSYNDIPGAQLHYLRGAGGQWSANGMPMIELPVATDGVVHITGSTEIPVTISAFGTGSVVSVQNLTLDETIASEVRLDQRRGRAVVASGRDSNPDIVVGYSDGQKNVETQVKRIRVRKGDFAAVATNRETNQVDVLARTTQDVDVQVTVRKKNDSGPPLEQRERKPADAQELAPLSDGMNPAPVIDAAHPPRETPGVRRTPGGVEDHQPNDVQSGGRYPANRTPNAADDGRNSARPTRAAQDRADGTPRPTKDQGQGGGPRPTLGPGDNGGGPRPTPGPGDNGGGPRPTRGSGDNGGGPRPTPGPGDNGGGPRPTPGPGDNGGGPRSTPGPGDNGGGPRPTPGPGENGGGPRPTPGPGDNGGGPRPTPGPGENGGGPRPTPGPGDNGGGVPPPTRSP